MLRRLLERREEQRALGAANRALVALGQSPVGSLAEVRPLTYSDVYGHRGPVKKNARPQ